MEVIKAHLIEMPQNKDDLISNFETKDEPKALSVLQWLIENGKVKENEANLCVWYK